MAHHEDERTTMHGALDLVAHPMLGLLEGALLQKHLDPNRTDLDRLFREMRQTVWLVLADRVTRAHAETGENRS